MANLKQLVKLLSKSGRQELVRNAAREYITAENISVMASEGVNSLLKRACSGIDDAKMERICCYCVEGGNLFSAVAKAVSDKVITTTEAKDICHRVQNLTGNLISQATIDLLIEKIVAKVP